jgi:hypothetical protein
MGSALIVTEWKNGRHVYTLAGERVPGVTTCTGVLAKPALYGWYAEQAASWAANNPDQLTALGHQDFIAMAKAAPNRVRDAAGGVGRDLHAHAEKLASTGEAPDVPDSDLAMVVQAADFLDAMGAQTVVAERAVYHDTFRYAGRLDLIAEIRGSIWLLDFKTGASGVWPEMALQQSAYRFATHMQGATPDADDEEMPPISHVGIVWIRPDGWQLVPVKADRDTWQAFLATIPLYRFLGQRKEATVGAPVAAGTATERPPDEQPQQ